MTGKRRVKYVIKKLSQKSNFCLSVVGLTSNMVLARAKIVLYFHIFSSIQDFPQ